MIHINQLPQGLLVPVDRLIIPALFLSGAKKGHFLPARIFIIPFEEF
jgi:hypothetical protein